MKFTLRGVLVALVFLCHFAQGTSLRAPICLDKKNRTVDCPPDDERPAEAGRSAQRRFHRKLDVLMDGAVVIDMRNGWFRVMDKAEWTTFNGVDGESNYCRVRLKSYAGSWTHGEDSDWNYYLTTDEATCADQKKLLMDVKDYYPFRNYKKIMCDSRFTDRCMSASWLWSQFLNRIAEQPIDSERLEIIGFPDLAATQKRLIKKYSDYKDFGPPPIHVAEYDHLQGTFCARYSSVGIICLTGDGDIYTNRRAEVPKMRVLINDYYLESGF